jgi:hypothetical protein
MSEDSSRKERKKDNDNVINNVINTSTTIRLIKTFSVAPKDLPIYEKFSQVARREAGSRGFSKALLKAMDEFNRRHGEGNYQLKLLNYIDEDEPSPHHVLCNYCKGVTREGKVFCTNPSVTPVYEMVIEKNMEGKWIPGVTCYSCKYNKLRR